MVDTKPTICNICNGEVVYTSNAKIYGKEYGSGKCYLCLNCGAYVGTHKPRPREALGVLADKKMRKGKMFCHELFDKHWKGKNKASKKRQDLYFWLSKQLEIDIKDCHFGYFDLETLRKAYKVLIELEKVGIVYDNKGRIISEVKV